MKKNFFRNIWLIAKTYIKNKRFLNIPIFSVVIVISVISVQKMMPFQSRFSRTDIINHSITQQSNNNYIYPFEVDRTEDEQLLQDYLEYRTYFSHPEDDDVEKDSITHFITSQPNYPTVFNRIKNFQQRIEAINIYKTSEQLKLILNMELKKEEEFYKEQLLKEKKEERLLTSSIYKILKRNEYPIVQRPKKNKKRRLRNILINLRTEIPNIRWSNKTENYNPRKDHLQENWQFPLEIVDIINLQKNNKLDKAWENVNLFITQYKNFLDMLEEEERIKTENKKIVLRFINNIKKHFKKTDDLISLQNSANNQIDFFKNFENPDPEDRIGFGNYRLLKKKPALINFSEIKYNNEENMPIGFLKFFRKNSYSKIRYEKYHFINWFNNLGHKFPKPELEDKKLQKQIKNNYNILDQKTIPFTRQFEENEYDLIKKTATKLFEPIELKAKKYFTVDKNPFNDIFEEKEKKLRLIKFIQSLDFNNFDSNLEKLIKEISPLKILFKENFNNPKTQLDKILLKNFKHFYPDEKTRPQLIHYESIPGERWLVNLKTNKFISINYINEPEFIEWRKKFKKSKAYDYYRKKDSKVVEFENENHELLNPEFYLLEAILDDISKDQVLFTKYKSKKKKDIINSETQYYPSNAYDILLNFLKKREIETNKKLKLKQHYLEIKQLDKEQEEINVIQKIYPKEKPIRLGLFPNLKKRLLTKKQKQLILEREILNELIQDTNIFNIILAQIDDATVEENQAYQEYLDNLNREFGFIDTRFNFLMNVFLKDSYEQFFIKLIQICYKTIKLKTNEKKLVFKNNIYYTKIPKHKNALFITTDSPEESNLFIRNLPVATIKDRKQLQRTKQLLPYLPSKSTFFYNPLRVKNLINKLEDKFLKDKKFCELSKLESQPIVYPDSAIIIAEPLNYNNSEIIIKDKNDFYQLVSEIIDDYYLYLVRKEKREDREIVPHVIRKVIEENRPIIPTEDIKNEMNKIHIFPLEYENYFKSIPKSTFLSFLTR